MARLKTQGKTVNQGQRHGRGWFWEWGIDKWWVDDRGERRIHVIKPD